MSTLTFEVARQQDNYKDIDLSFRAHPATGDIIKKTGAEAVKGAIRNLLFLKLGELGFNPQKGAGLYHYLFENITPATLELITGEIDNTIKAFEPRIILLNLVISESAQEPNGINIDIEFQIKNYNTPVTMRLFLERVR